MKMKLKKRRQEGLVLIMESSEDEELIYAEAECVRQGCDTTLMGFDYAQKKRKGYEFKYYLETSKPLGEYLYTPLSNGYFEGMLVSFLRLAQSCESLNLSTQRVLYDPKYIFFDPARYSLKFVYLPIRMKKGKTSDSLSALAFLVENAQFENTPARNSAEKVLDFVRRAPIFSWIDYEQLLRDLGILTHREATQNQSIAVGQRDTARVDFRGDFGYDFVSFGREEVVRAPYVAQAHQASPVGPDSSTASANRFTDEEHQDPPMGLNSSTALEQHQLAKSFNLVRVADGATWHLFEGRTVVGSSQECDLCIEGIAGLSRKHAAFFIRDRECFLEDLGSTNGTGVEGSRLATNRQVRVMPGNHIQFAKTLFRLIDVDEGSETTCPI